MTTEANQAANETGQSQEAATETVTLTKAELNSMMAASRRSGEQSSSRRAEPATPPVQVAQAQAQPDVITEMRAQIDAMSKQNAFDRALIGRNISAENVSVLHELYVAQKPTDLQAWIDPAIARFGLGKPAIQPPGAPAAAPSSVVPVAFDVLNAVGPILPIQLSAEQRANHAVLRQVNEHNKAILQRASGAPPRREPPGRK